MAEKFPERFFLGVEKNVTCAGISLKKIVEKELKNVKFLFRDGAEVIRLLKSHSVKKIYLNFSDPWPKKRHSKRRLTSVSFLEEYKRILTKDGVLVFKTDDVLDLDKIKSKLVAIGYERMPMVEGRGQFSIRGGIIDIFPFTSETPVRIELWDDEIDSIRYFDVDSQRSIEKVKEIRVFPATEYIFTEEEIEEGLELIEKEAKAQLQVFNIEKKRRSKEDIDAGNAIRKLVADAKRTGDYSRFIKAFSSETVGFADYLPKGKTLIVLDELHRLKEKSDLVSYEYEESMKHRLSCGMVLPCQTSLIRPMDEIMAGLKDFKKLTLSALDYTYKLNKIDFSMNLETRTISSYNNSFEMLANDLAK